MGLLDCKLVSYEIGDTQSKDDENESGESGGGSILVMSCKGA